MTTPDPIAGLDGLYLVAKQLVSGLYTGRHASPLRGAGIEFHDYRPYTPGDDLRTIDWKLFGRTDRYYLKRYRRETDLNLHVAVDGSASMAFASLGSNNKRNDKSRWHGRPAREESSLTPTKFAIAQRLAAALCTLAVRQGDRAGLSVFDQKLRCLHPASGSIRQLQAMIADLEHAEPAQGQADIAASLEQLGKTLRGRRSVIAVVSDLLDEPGPLMDVFDRLRFAGHEVLVFQVLTPDELSLPDDRRGLRLIDMEAGPTINTQPTAIAQRYQQLMQQHLDTLRRQLAARNIDHVMVKSDETLIGVLRLYLVRRASRH